MIERDSCSETGASANGSAAPRWECRFPDRMAYELRSLEKLGIEPEIDRTRLDRHTQLALRFNWRLHDGRLLQLYAVYPDSFPYLRPQVYVEGGLDSPLRQHQSPIDGNLCLLGRDTSQWLPSLTLGRLLYEQLEHAVHGTGEEDPQGEPAEYWWNSLGAKDAYCLVDSSWDLNEIRSGTLTVKYRVAGYRSEIFGNVERDAPILQAMVSEVYDDDGTLLYEWSAPIPSHLVSGNVLNNVPYIQFEDALFPEREIGKQVDSLIESNSKLQHAPRIGVGHGMSIQLLAMTFPSELGHDASGTGWAFPYRYGVTQAFKPQKKKKKIPVRVGLLPVYRGGESDLSHRSPQVDNLRNKAVLLVGVGAIGSPLAVGLARNRCGKIHLLDYDVLEPGNSVRWVLGYGMWGRQKAEALAEWIGVEYPWTQAESHVHAIGQKMDSSDIEVLKPLLEDVDLVIDASASHGVTTFVADRCVRARIPCISVSATPTVEGGIVAEFAPGGGCPICLEHYWHDGTVESPRGMGKEDALIQPPGCAERTFTGASYELEEIALQAIRVVVQVLSGDTRHSPSVYTLNLNPTDDGTTLPAWRKDAFPQHPRCVHER